MTLSRGTARCSTSRQSHLHDIVLKQRLLVENLPQPVWILAIRLVFRLQAFCRAQIEAAETRRNASDHCRRARLHVRFPKRQHLDEPFARLTGICFERSYFSSTAAAAGPPEGPPAFFLACWSRALDVKCTTIPGRITGANLHRQAKHKRAFQREGMIGNNDATTLKNRCAHKTGRRAFTNLARHAAVQPTDLSIAAILTTKSIEKMKKFNVVCCTARNLPEGRFILARFLVAKIDD